MPGATFPQTAGELFIPGRPETPPSPSAASSRAGHHNAPADAQVAGRVGSVASGSDLATVDDISRQSQRAQMQNLHVVTDLQRGAPGDMNIAGVSKRTSEQAMKAKQAHQFYGEVFSYREPTTNVRDRVARDSVVTVEVKTNVMVNDEYSLLTGLSTFFSQRYNRSEESILISLTHSTCLLLAGSFEPAYLMTITALPALVGSATNKRNSALIQAYMAEEMRVAANRGVIRFAAVEEASLATNGTTVLADIESRSKNSASRNYPPVPVPSSPKSTHTEHNTARSFFGKRASKRSLREPQQLKVKASASASASASAFGDGTLLRRSQSRQQERQELVPGKGAHGRQPSGDRNAADNELLTEADEQTSAPPTRDGPALRGSFSQRFHHSRKTSGETADERSTDTTAPTSEDEEEARIAAARLKVPKEMPSSPADTEATKVKAMPKRKSLRTMFGMS